MRLRLRIALAVVATLGLCLSNLITNAGETKQVPVLTIEQYPRIDGSTSTQPLSTLMACRFTHTAFEWGTLSKFDRTRTLYPSTDPYDPEKQLVFPEGTPQALGQPKNIDSALWRKIAHTDTHKSYINLINRDAEIILASREPSDDEIILARHQGVEIQTIPMALDAFVFIVNSQNPQSSLTVEEVRNIYAGQLANWTDLGQELGEIRPYSRDKNSGSEEKMQQLVMKGLPMTKTRPLTLMLSMIGPFNAIRHDRQGIGYTSYYYERYMANTPQVKVIAINNVLPSKETIGDDTYPLVTQAVVAYLSDLPSNSQAARIRDWLLTSNGQKIVGESGYIPVKR